jgi:8-oxo-dGTP diphosphatase
MMDPTKLPLDCGFSPLNCQTDREVIEGNPETIGVAAVVVRADRLLVIRRSRLVRSPGKLCFPGGRREPGESEAEALVREFQEELGAAARPVRRLWQSVTPWGVSLAWWLTSLDPDTPLSPFADEVEAALWLTVPELRASPDLLESNLLFLDAHAAGAFCLE